VKHYADTGMGIARATSLILNGNSWCAAHL
jgi:hypothetical protein